jgi:hypothetical protein
MKAKGQKLFGQLQSIAMVVPGVGKIEKPPNVRDGEH